MNKLIKALSNDKNIRYYVVDTTQIVKDIKQKHNPSFGALMAMSKVATFAALYGPSILSDKEKVTIKIAGNGTIGTIYCDTNNKGEIKIMATNPYAQVPFVNNKPDFNQVIGTSGTMVVTKDLQMRENYQAISPILKGDICDTFSYFMQTSEQKPSGIGIGLNFTINEEILNCGGFMSQLLPDATPENYENLEKQIKSLPNINTLFKEFKQEEILEFLSHNDYKIIDSQDVKFYCDCTKERFIKKIIALDKKDVNEIFEKQEKIEVVCEFCKTKYMINKEDIYGK